MGPHKGPKGTLSKPKGPGPRKRATNQNDARQIQSIEPNGHPQGSHDGPTKVPQIKKPKSMCMYIYICICVYVYESGDMYMCICIVYIRIRGYVYVYMYTKTVVNRAQWAPTRVPRGPSATPKGQAQERGQPTKMMRDKSNQ